MRSLKLEQVAVIKFLTLEGTSASDIYKRLKKVFLQFTLTKEKVNKLYARFVKEELLGLGYEDGDSYKKEEWDSCEMHDNSDMEDELNENQNYNDEISMEESEDDDGITEFVIKTESDDSKYSPSHDPLETSSIELIQKAAYDVKNNFEGNSRVKKISVSFPMNDQHEIKVSSLKLRKKEKSHLNLVNDDIVKNIELPFLPIMSIIQCEELLIKIHRSTNLQCLLCEDNSFKVFSKLTRHLKSAHLRHSVILATVRSLQCKKHCQNSNRKNCNITKRAHYHCNICTWYFYCRQRLSRHYVTHLTQSEKYSFPGEFDTSIFRCVTINEIDGIYLVRKSRFMCSEPVHVRKKNICVGVETIRIAECSEELCQEAMKSAKDNGNYKLECKHIASVILNGKTQVPSFHFTLNEDLFNNLSYPLSAEEFQACMALSEAATQMHTPLLVEWVETDTIIFFSIYCDEPFAVMGRMLIKLDTMSISFVCKCPFDSSHFCPYKVISEIYFYSCDVQNA